MLRFAYYALWIAPAVIFAALAAIMVRRGARKQFPFFFAYVVYQVVGFVLQFYTYHRQSPLTYFYTYWTLQALSIGLSFCVIHELFAATFAPFHGLRDLGTVLFRWAAVVLLLIAAVMAVTSPAGQGKRAVAIVIVLSLERSVRAMQCGMVLLMILCAPYLGIRFRQRAFGIATGFGMIAAVDLIAVAALATWGEAASLWYNMARMATFNFAALLWTGYFLAPEPERLPVSRLAHSDRWNFALATLGNPEGAVPAVPMIVEAVERLWSKSNGHTAPQHADQ